MLYINIRTKKLDVYLWFMLVLGYYIWIIPCQEKKKQEKQSCKYIENL